MIYGLADGFMLTVIALRMAPTLLPCRTLCQFRLSVWIVSGALGLLRFFSCSKIDRHCWFKSVETLCQGASHCQQCLGLLATSCRDKLQTLHRFFSRLFSFAKTCSWDKPLPPLLLPLGPLVGSADCYWHVLVVLTKDTSRTWPLVVGLLVGLYIGHQCLVDTIDFLSHSCGIFPLLYTHSGILICSGDFSLDCVR